MLPAKEEGFLDGMLGFLVSYMAKLGRWVDLLEFFSSLLAITILCTFANVSFRAIPWWLVES
jgi:hypothetical protein